MNEYSCDPLLGDAIESAVGRTHGSAEAAVVTTLLTNDSRNVMSLFGEPLVGVT